MTDVALPSFQPEPRCHVCRTDSICKLVNRLLAEGSSYAQIVRVVAAEGGEAVSLDSVRNHASRHFPVQNAAHATYREIVERRATQYEIDFVEGLATALTPIAFMETLMVKAYELLVQDDTEVSIEIGLKAAEKLHAVIGGRDPGADQARMMAEMDNVIQAVKSVVPPSMLKEISARLRGPDPHPRPAEPSARLATFRAAGTPDDDTFDPGDDDDDDDDF